MSHLQNYIWKRVLLFVISICSYTSLWSIDIITKAQVVTASDGTKVAVWEVKDGVTTIIEGATFDGVSWSAPFLISTVGEKSSTPKLHINALGHVVVGWFAVDTTNQVLVFKAATKLLGFGFTAPVAVSSPTTDHVLDFNIYVDAEGPTGNIYAVWNAVNITPTFSTKYSQSVFGAAWSAPIQLR